MKQRATTGPYHCRGCGDAVRSSYTIVVAAGVPPQIAEATVLGMDGKPHVCPTPGTVL